MTASTEPSEAAASEQPPAGAGSTPPPSADAPQGKLGPTALRFASAVPLIALLLWLLFSAPPSAFISSR